MFKAKRRIALSFVYIFVTVLFISIAVFLVPQTKINDFNDYSNLFIAYSLARDIAVHSKNVDYKDEMLVLLVRRILSDIKQLFDIKQLVEANIKNNKSILEKMEQSMLKISFTNDYLKKFLEEGTMTKEDLYEFFEGDEVREKYRRIEQEIKAL